MGADQSPGGATGRTVRVARPATVRSAGRSGSVRPSVTAADRTRTVRTVRSPSGRTCPASGRSLPNILQDKWFYLLGNHKNVSRVIWDKGEDREENIETMDIVTAIASFGGFVFSTEMKTMPKEYLTMH